MCNDTRWCQCHMNFGLSINRISGDIIYFNNILIKLCSTINAHGFHVCRHMIMVPNRSTKDDGVVRKKVPVWLAHISMWQVDKRERLLPTRGMFL